MYVHGFSSIEELPATSPGYGQCMEQEGQVMSTKAAK
jgi:hypothetical protein